VKGRGEGRQPPPSGQEVDRRREDARREVSMARKPPTFQ
jgi:hypothetical protein